MHRLDKGKQDFLLPYLENGTIILIGATTSNPYHAINPAIRSRCQIFELFPLTEEDMKLTIKRALTDEEYGLGKYNIELDNEAFEHLATASNGDARSALNALELAVLSTEPDDKGVIRITTAVAEECLQKKASHMIKMATPIMMC